MADLANSTRTPSRRALLSLAASTAACSTAGLGIALAAEPHPDADLLAMEAEFLALDAKVERARDVVHSLDRVVYERCGYDKSIFPTDVPGLVERISQARRDVGYSAAEAVAEAAGDEAFAVADDLLLIPALTLDGLRCKARVIKRSGLVGCADNGSQHIIADLLAMKNASADFS